MSKFAHFWHAPTVCRPQTLSGIGEKSRLSSTHFQTKVWNWAGVGDFILWNFVFSRLKRPRMCQFGKNQRFFQKIFRISPPEAGRASRRDLIKIRFKNLILLAKRGRSWWVRLIFALAKISSNRLSEADFKISFTSWFGSAKSAWLKRFEFAVLIHLSELARIHIRESKLSLLTSSCVRRDFDNFLSIFRKNRCRRQV